MKKVLYKQHSNTTDNSYSQTKAALEFLYQESLRNHSPELAAILQQTIQNCEDLIEGDVIKLGDAADAIYCLKFIKSFMDLDTGAKKEILGMLLLE